MTSERSERGPSGPAAGRERTTSERSEPGRTALLVSPHLDDVAFSAGGTAIALALAGWRVVVVTAFSASVAEPRGFALACQLDKGLAADVDYLALRRAEDAEFARRAGAAPRWLGRAEAPHRGYGSAAELFAGVRPDDVAADDVAGALASLLAAERPDLVAGPQALGAHVDHLQVVRALAAVVGGRPTAWYRDLPYALRQPGAEPSPDLPGGLVEVAVRVDGRAKADAVAAYATQLGFQFGGEQAMRALLGALPTEVFLADEAAAAVLAADEVGPAPPGPAAGRDRLGRQGTST